MVDLEKIEYKAAEMRISIIESIGQAGSGHPGGSLSATDILAVLYFSGIMNFPPVSEITNDGLLPTEKASDFDHFILSKGHAAPAYYAALALAGFLEKEELATLRKLGSRLQGHPESTRLPGVEVSTGSLGQGLSISAGYAIGLLLNEKRSYMQDGFSKEESIEKAKVSAPTVFTVLGDGELQEGQVWEAAQFAAHNNTSNLVAIIDKNELQIDGSCKSVVEKGEIADKFNAFGWKTLIIDGHDCKEIYDALEWAKSYNEGPVAIIANTVKGKGVSFMEGKVGWHGKAPKGEELENALKELRENL